MHEVRFCYKCRKSPPVQAYRHSARSALTRQPIVAPRQIRRNRSRPFDVTKRIGSSPAGVNPFDPGLG